MVVAVMPASKDSCPNRKIRTDGINDRKAAAKAMPAFSMLICGKYNERGIFSSLSRKIIGCYDEAAFLAHNSTELIKSNRHTALLKVNLFRCLSFTISSKEFRSRRLRQRAWTEQESSEFFSASEYPRADQELRQP